MKRLLSVIAWTLALNFLAVAGALAWAWRTGRLDHEKVGRIKEIVLAPGSQPATRPAGERADAATQPSLRLEQLLARASGRTAGEQAEFMQRSFDAQMAVLDRRYREVQELQKTVEHAQRRLDADRQKVLGERAKLAAQQQEQKRLMTDQGFQDTLQLYSGMPGKQVKTVFMTLDDATVIQYLRAMEPRVATKVVKEFKTAAETERIARVMEKMRQAAEGEGSAGGPSSGPVSAGAAVPAGAVPAGATVPGGGQVAVQP